MATKIIVDSTCDLTKDICDKNDITILPLHVLLGENEYKDGVDITIDEIYAWADKNGDTPKTSAPALSDAIHLFKEYKDSYDDFVCLSISSSMSSSFNVFHMAALELDILDRVYLVDSMNLSNGVGLLALEASDLAKEGKSGQEIQDALFKIVSRVRTSFIVDTLEYLHRGGRCSGAAALMSGTLKIHPKIVVENGEMKVSKKYRGVMNKVILHYLKDHEESLLKSDKKRLFLVNSGVEESILKDAKEYIASLNHFDEIIEDRAGAVISSHCGPGTYGVVFVEGE